MYIGDPGFTEADDEAGVSPGVRRAPETAAQNGDSNSGGGVSQTNFMTQMVHYRDGRIDEADPVLCTQVSVSNVCMTIVPNRPDSPVFGERSAEMDQAV